MPNPRIAQITTDGLLGPLRYLLFCFAGGFAAMMTQAGMTLWFGTAADGRAPNLGASSAIAALLGAYFVLYPGSRVTTWIFPVFIRRIPAWIYLGLWFLYQLLEANFGLFNASANGVAFFAHVGGFVFGLLATSLLARTGQAAPAERDRRLPAGKSGWIRPESTSRAADVIHSRVDDLGVRSPGVRAR